MSKLSYHTTHFTPFHPTLFPPLQTTLPPSHPIYPHLILLTPISPLLYPSHIILPPYHPILPPYHPIVPPIFPSRLISPHLITTNITIHNLMVFGKYFSTDRPESNLNATPNTTHTGNPLSPLMEEICQQIFSLYY